MIGAIVSIPFILTPALCMENEDPARGVIISTMIFVTGIVTFIQATWGCRLPIVQVRSIDQFFLSSKTNIKETYILGWNNIISSSCASYIKFTAMEMSKQK